MKARPDARVERGLGLEPASGEIAPGDRVHVLVGSGGEEENRAELLGQRDADVDQSPLEAADQPGVRSLADVGCGEERRNRGDGRGGIRGPADEHDGTDEGFAPPEVAGGFERLEVTARERDRNGQPVANIPGPAQREGAGAGHSAAAARSDTAVVRVALGADHPTLRATSADQAPKENRAPLAGDAVVMSGYVAADPVPHSTPARKRLVKRSQASQVPQLERGPPSNVQAEKLKFLSPQAFRALGR